MFRIRAVEEVLGAGSFATVRRAKILLPGTTSSSSQTSRHESELTAAAVKTIRVNNKDNSGREGSLRGALREAAVLREIGDKQQHSFVISLLGVLRDDACGAVHLAFRLENETCDLGVVLAMVPGKLLPSATVVWFGAQVAAALRYLHAASGPPSTSGGPLFVHRDLKPENLLVNPSCYLQIADFGAAKRLDLKSLRGRREAKEEAERFTKPISLYEREKTYTICGSPAYLAPEVLAEKGHGLAVDLWQLGVLLAELRTGAPPFANDTPAKLYADILHGTFSNMFLQFQEDQEDLRRVITKRLLLHDARKRATAAEVLGVAPFAELDVGRLERKELRSPFTMQDLCGDHGGRR